MDELYRQAEELVSRLKCDLEFERSAADGAHAGPGHLSVRPERIAINTSDRGLVQGNATRHIYLGTDVHVEVTLTRGEKVTVRMQNSAQIQIPEVGQAVGLEFEADAARLLVD